MLFQFVLFKSGQAMLLRRRRASLPETPLGMKLHRFPQLLGSELSFSMPRDCGLLLSSKKNYGDARVPELGMIWRSLV